MTTPAYTRDPSSPDAEPRLALFLNLGNLADLPATSIAPTGDPREVLAALHADGFEGVQGGEAETAQAVGMKHASGGRSNAVGEIDPLCKRWNDEGSVCATLHVGW